MVRRATQGRSLWVPAGTLVALRQSYLFGVICGCRVRLQFAPDAKLLDLGRHHRIFRLIPAARPVMLGQLDVGLPTDRRCPNPRQKCHILDRCRFLRSLQSCDHATPNRTLGQTGCVASIDRASRSTGKCSHMVSDVRQYHKVPRTLKWKHFDPARHTAIGPRWNCPLALASRINSCFTRTTRERPFMAADLGAG